MTPSAGAYTETDDMARPVGHILDTINQAKLSLFHFIPHQVL